MEHVRVVHNIKYMNTHEVFFFWKTSISFVLAHIIILYIIIVDNVFFFILFVVSWLYRLIMIRIILQGDDGLQFIIVHANYNYITVCIAMISRKN